MSAAVPEAEAERRLRPVLDALYAHNSKQAIKLVQQALQKRPGWPAARALRACIYLQTERFAEAHREITAIRHDIDHALVPVNEDAAKKLHMYYQEVRCDHLAGEVYELVWKAQPSELRLAEIAFGLYICGNAFSNAQKIATRMHRLAAPQTQKYAFWATAALWLAVTYEARSSVATVSQMDTRMLKLGCAIMSKALDASTAPPSAETVRFATRVFKQAGDFSKAIQLVSHPRLVMDDAEVLHLRADISFAESKNAADFHKLLTDHAPNDWGYWLRYFECVGQGQGPDWINNAKDFVDQLVHSAHIGKEPHRGPYLARMELLYRDADWDALVDDVVRYFRLFGNKTVVSRDLRPWIALLQESNLHQLTLEKLQSVASESSFLYTLHVFWLQLWFGCLDESPRNLFQRYVDQKIDGLEPTDRQPGDDFLILAAHKILPLVNGSSRYGNASAVLKAIFMLEGGLTASPFNHDIKLLLIRLYTAIGGMERVSELWDSLDVKNVQLSTLTHIVLGPLYESGHHEHLQSVLENVNSLWREIDREIPECTTRAFLEGSLNAAVDFVLFKLRLERSAILAEAMVIDAQMNVILTDGEPHGVQRSLSLLTVQPRFTSEDFTGKKRIVTNEDSLCYRFWDYCPYDKESRLDSLRDEFLEEGVTCSASRVATLSGALMSSMVLLRLTEQNGNEGVREKTNKEANTTVPDTVSNGNDADVSVDIKLRLDIALNLKEVQSILYISIAPPNSEQVNGGTNHHSAVDIDRVLNRSKELSQAVLRRVKNALETGTSKSSDNELSFPTTIRECGKIVYDVLLVVAVALSSFSPVLTKGQRRMKKSGAKGETKDTKLSESFEKGRGAIVIYRDAVLSATGLIHEWVTDNVQKDLDWSARLFESEGLSEELPHLIPDELYNLNPEDGSRVTKTPVNRTDFCNQIVERIRSSHSTSCMSLLNTLTAIARRLRLADL